MRAKKSRIAELSFLAIGATLLAPYAIAQDAPAADTATTDKAADAAAEGDVTTILVTGVRAALQSAQEIKRSADTMVESITATKIGASRQVHR